jgi:hypothetical protein
MGCEQHDDVMEGAELSGMMMGSLVTNMHKRQLGFIYLKELGCQPR